jgi:hypothetical protein
VYVPAALAANETAALGLDEYSVTCAVVHVTIGVLEKVTLMISLLSVGRDCRPIWTTPVHPVTRNVGEEIAYT